MKLLLIVSLATVAMCQEAFVSQKLTESNDVPQATTILQVQPETGLQTDNKKIDKRSHGWGGWGGHGHGWPSYHGWGHGHYGGWGGFGGHGFYGGWYPSWPLWHYSGWHGGYGSHGGYHHGWHSKW